MTERLAIPAWNTPPTSLDDWSKAIQALGPEVVTNRESTGVAWLEVGAIRLRGYAMLQGAHVEAINFETSAADPAPALALLAQAAAALGWELHEDDDEDGEDDKDDDD